MLSWFTSARLSDNDDLRGVEVGDATYMEPPETPAPVFAVRAFKHALFGTPAPHPANPDTPAPAKKEEQQSIAKTKERELPRRKENPRLATATVTATNTATATATTRPKSAEIILEQQSPTKPAGILMTPGTISQRRKTVSFGAQVVDNEGKPSIHLGKSGLPNDFPGKFPSPFTPKSTIVADEASAAKSNTALNSNSKPRTKLTQSLYEARDSVRLTPNQKPRAKDDHDITIDFMEPRSESGKYWKGQYESYSQQSEKEVKKLIVKQTLAKKFAQKKDEDAMKLAVKLDDERKKHKIREGSLEQENKELQNQLKKTSVDHVAALAEIAALKQKLAALERKVSAAVAVTTTTAAAAPAAAPSYEPEKKKPEDDKSILFEEMVSTFDFATEESPVRIRRTGSFKSRSPIKPRTRISRTPQSKATTTTITAAAPLTASATKKAEDPFEPRMEIPRSPLKERQLNEAKENVKPAAVPSSPFISSALWDDLPQPSPIANIDRLAFPISTALPSATPFSTTTRQSRVRSPPKPSPVRTSVITPKEIMIDISTTPDDSKPPLPVDRKAAARERLRRKKEGLS